MHSLSLSVEEVEESSMSLRSSSTCFYEDVTNDVKLHITFKMDPVEVYIMLYFLDVGFP